ncbi:Lipase [Operophtera brumata]|uniref:Lipase n=1 Tax=Operophtera brumata TaxID=104452 RepID=A0A0L7L3I1_OPEBR|nr:Lipase [Operophtera brumata]
MNLQNVNFIQSVILVFCFGYVQNKRKTKEIDTITDPNSDINLNSLQLISKYGNVPQRHTVITEDGYIVNVLRIPNKGPPVLFVHGIGDSSDSWLVTGPSSSLAYQLSSLGFDIWLYNSRGNKYSKGHVKNLPDKQYWDFGYEEMGYQDLPAVIDYITSITNKSKIYYIGYSQGTTLFLIMCSLRPEYNDRIRQAVLLAPVAWLSNTKHPYLGWFANNHKLIKSVLDSLGFYNIFENNFLQKIIHSKICRNDVPEKVFCELEYALSYGLRNLTNLNTDRLQVISTHIPAGVSTKTFIHFFQIYLSKRFQRYDLGAKRNNLVYSSAQPPEFPISSITAPVNLFVSDSDWFSTVEDVKTLRELMPNIVSYVEFNKSLDFTHLEFVYGERAKSLVNDPAINIILRDLYSNSIK